MSERRPLRLLCCWDYGRKGWTAPLEALGADHGYDLTYLFHRRREEEGEVATAWPRRYWSEFRDAQTALDALQPDRIVFMGLDGAWTIALNGIARERGIPTFLLQHGITAAPEYLASAGMAPRPQRRGPSRLAARLPALAFLARSFRRRPHDTVRVIRLMAAADRDGFTRTARRRIFGARLPDLHLVTGPATGLLPSERDGAAAQEISVVGLPEYEGRSVTAGGAKDPGDAVLVVDTPHTGVAVRPATVGDEAKATAFRRLGAELASHGLHLRVKLHPYSYGDDWTKDDRSVTYLRDADLDAELERAAVVVGFESTLMILALAVRPCVLVRMDPHPLAELASALGAVPVIDGLDDLSGDRIVSALEEGRRPTADDLVAAFAGPPPWSAAPLAAAVRDPVSAPRLRPEDLNGSAAMIRCGAACHAS